MISNIKSYTDFPTQPPPSIPPLLPLLLTLQDIFQQSVKGHTMIVSNESILYELSIPI